MIILRAMMLNGLRSAYQMLLASTIQAYILIATSFFEGDLQFYL